MAHQYVRRTFEEAKEMARLAFQKTVESQLDAAEIEDIRAHAHLTGGSVGPGWEAIVGFSPSDHDFYELQLYKPQDEQPYIEKSYVRILAPRNRSSEVVHFMWRPSI